MYITATPIPSPRLREHLRKVARKTVRTRGQEGTGEIVSSRLLVTDELLNSQQLWLPAQGQANQHSARMEACSLHKVKPISLQHGWRRVECAPICSWEALGSWWVRGRTISFLYWMTSHSWTTLTVLNRLFLKIAAGGTWSWERGTEGTLELEETVWG